MLRHIVIVSSAILLSGWPALPQSSTSAIATVSADLAKLSGILGRMHALQVICNGRTDQFWRDQMNQLLMLEAPEDGPVRRKLIEDFNTAFTTQEAETAVCNDMARSAFKALAEEGQLLSEVMNTSVSGGN
jgi:uncharacterized protein (TIGR02301 family)